MVDSVNTSAAAETLYTPTSGLNFNPSTNKLTVTSASVTGLSTFGDISGSGLNNILGYTTSSVLNLKTTDNIDVGNDLYVDQIRRHSDSSTTTKLNLGDEVFKIYTGHASNEVVNVQNDRLSINTNITASGEISLADNKKLSLGDKSGGDGNIKHTGTNLQIAETTGHIQITNYKTDGDIVLSTDDGSGGETPYVTLDGGDVSTRIHTNITASGDISGSAGKIVGFATASVVGPIRGKQLQVYHANWKDDPGTTEIYVPLAGVPDEMAGSTSGIKEQSTIIAPCDGTIKEIILRMHWASTITTSDDITWKLYTRANGTKMNDVNERSSFTMTNPTQATSDANNTRRSGTLNQAFDAGDAISISMQWASTGPTHTADRIYVTVVIEYDWDTVSY